MIDFATKLPRVASLAVTFGEATGNITEPKRALLDAALTDIPKLEWDAPASLLQSVRIIHAAREAAGPCTTHFDNEGNGPWCQHGHIPLICPLCGRVWELEDRLLETLVRLARAS